MSTEVKTAYESYKVSAGRMAGRFPKISMIHATLSIANNISIAAKHAGAEDLRTP